MLCNECLKCVDLFVNNGFVNKKTLPRTFRLRLMHHSFVPPATSTFPSAVSVFVFVIIYIFC